MSLKVGLFASLLPIRNSVRIGFSPRLIRKLADIWRLDLREIQQAAEPIQMLGCIPGTPATERWLHGKFSAEHQNKKWFRASEKLRSFMTPSASGRST